MQENIKHEISVLDFLRGWAAIFVFFHHASILGGGPRILSGHMGQEAVNAFMFASGFLIFYQCAISKTYQQLKNYEGIKSFYIRRFFRISPLFYSILMVALFMSHYLGESRENITQVLSSGSTDLGRYYIENYIENFLIHITYLFGLSPQYSFSSPLPDWSLGLEMQFYLMFPILFWAYQKNFLIGLLASLLIMFGIQLLLGTYDIHFSMPSFLPLKFQNFSAGIALAYLFLNKEHIKKSSFWAVIILTILALLVINKNIYMILLFSILCFYLCSNIKGLRGGRSILERLFSHAASKFLADISYSVYLTHLLIMLPFFSYILQNGKLSKPEWAISSLVLLLIVFLISFITYRLIEIPGIKFGKFLIKK